MSLLRSLTAAGTTALGLVLAAGTLSPAHASAADAATPPTVQVVASELPTGAAPRHDFVVDQRIVRPGKRALRLPDHTSEVLRARGGYLVVTEVVSARDRYRGNQVRFLSDSGRQRVLLRLTQEHAETVATDGRTVVIGRSTRSGARLRVLRVRDGRQVGRVLRVTGDLRGVPAVSPSRVLVRTQSRAGATARLRWWSPRTGRVVPVPIDRVPARRPSPVNPRTEAASALRHVVTLPTGQVIDDRRPARRLWTLRRNEAGLRFSPSARRLLTVSHGEDTSQNLDFTHVRAVTVRDARSGRRAVTFRGVFAFDATRPSGAIVWEDDDSFLVVAADEILQDEEGEQYVTNPRLVRCTVLTRACEMAGRDVEPWGIQPVVPRSR